MSVLAVWGLDDDAERLYRGMLRNPDLTPHALADLVDLHHDSAERALKALEAADLVRREGNRLIAVPPGAALSAMLSIETERLEERRNALEALRVALPTFAADHVAGRASAAPHAPVEIVAREASVTAVEDMQRSTHGEILVVQPVLEIAAAPADYIELNERQLAEGRPMRAIYPSDVVEDLERLEWVRSWSARGERVRLSRDRLPELAVFGDDLAFLSSEWGGEVGSRYVLHARPLVAVAQALFDALWARSVPFGRPDQQRDESGQVLQLLALGAKDEAIARQLGLSLRTVRRRVADLMAEHGVDSRFQLGVVAERDGLL